MRGDDLALRGGDGRPGGADVGVERFQLSGVALGVGAVGGAAGGVGSTAISLLSAKGYDIVASTGRVAEAREYLETLAASAKSPRLRAQVKELAARVEALEKSRS